MAIEPKESMNVAMMPLGDGRQLMVPLEVLAEVQQLKNQLQRATGDLGTLNWRGMHLAIESLDAVCGLPAPPGEELATVGVFKAAGNSERPFRALAFTGTAANARIDAGALETQEIPDDGYFVGATRMQGQLYLIPDLEKLLFSD